MSAQPPPESGSPFETRDQLNPYQASVAGESATAMHPAALSRPLPVFVTVMMIISIVLCVCRLGMAVFNAIALMFVLDRPVQPLEWMDLMLAGVIVVSGIVAAALILLKRHSGLQLAYVHAVAVAISIVIGVIQVAGRWDSVTSEFGGGAAAQIGFAVVEAISVGLRFAIVAIYVAALLKFRQWLSGR